VIAHQSSDLDVREAKIKDQMALVEFDDVSVCFFNLAFKNLKLKICQVELGGEFENLLVEGA
jgi:hypothetical protein